MAIESGFLIMFQPGGNSIETRLTRETHLHRLQQPPPLESYEYSQRIAVGGMAEIFLAWQTGPSGFRRQVAVKHPLPHLTADPDFVALLLREAHLAADLSHPNIVSVLDVLNPGGHECLIVMEYVHGPTLRELLNTAAKKAHAIPIEVAVHITVSICAALDYAHNAAGVGNQPRRIVHRDVTPTNILISTNGQVKLGDFGIARTYSAETVTRTGVVRGKAAYMSPEQTRGETLDQRSDLFSVGAILYEMLTCVQPFHRTGGEAAIAHAVLNDPIPDPTVHVPNMKPALARVLNRALARERAARYPSAAHLAADLRAAIGPSTLPAEVSLAELIKRLFPDMVSKPDPHIREERETDSEAPTTVVVTRSHRGTITSQRPAISTTTPPPPPAAALARRQGPRFTFLLLVAGAVLSAIVWWIVITQAR